VNWPKQPHKLSSYPEQIVSSINVPRDYSLKVSSCHQTAAVVRTLIFILSSAPLVDQLEVGTLTRTRAIQIGPASTRE
jgi:hypothetical protein